MQRVLNAHRRMYLVVIVIMALGVCTGSAAAAAGREYQSIVPSAASTTVVLTGNDLTIDQLLQVARYGARVQLSAAAKQRQNDNYGLLLEAQAEGVPVYNLNRGGGLGRSIQILDGDPLSPGNKALLEKRELAAFEDGALYGGGPEIAEEEVIRATMAIRANGMVHEMPSPQLSQMLLDLLNDGITPVMQSQGTVGESDWNLLPNIGGAMVGKGEVHYHGVRLTAAQALHRAGLTPLKPFALDSSTLANSNGYTTALAAFLVSNARRALEWTDLAYAMDLNGMNSSVTPLTAPVQLSRPFKWLNWDAARVLEMLKGSYLFDGDPQRILADADSLRASAIRQGAAWQAWSTLRDDVVMQMNSSDHNPSVMLGLSPTDSWDLATPQMLKYYVKGGKYSDNHHGYIVASANWDPYPMVNDIEAFTNALANAAVAVSQRIYRFDNVFFAALNPADLLSDEQLHNAPRANPMLIAHLWQQLQIAAAAVPAEGVATDSQGNGDIQSQAAIKATRGLEATDLMLQLVGQDLLTSSFWMNLRKIQDPSRSFGAAPDAAWRAFRGVIPWGRRLDKPLATLAGDFVRDTPVAQFYASSIVQPMAAAAPLLQPADAPDWKTRGMRGGSD